MTTGHVEGVTDRNTRSTSNPAGDNRGGKEIPLPPEAHGRIAAQLREVYGQMLAEPMPDKFAQLLDKLAQSDPASRAKPEPKS